MQDGGQCICCEQRFVFSEEISSKALLLNC